MLSTAQPVRAIRVCAWYFASHFSSFESTRESESSIQSMPGSCIAVLRLLQPRSEFQIVIWRESRRAMLQNRQMKRLLAGLWKSSVSPAGDFADLASDLSGRA